MKLDAPIKYALFALVLVSMFMMYRQSDQISKINAKITSAENLLSGAGKNLEGIRSEVEMMRASTSAFNAYLDKSKSHLDSISIVQNKAYARFKNNQELLTQKIDALRGVLNDPVEKPDEPRRPGETK